MGLWECFSLAINSLRVNKLRSALTLLGIVIGVASVITMVSMGEGAQQLVSGEISSLGANLIWIQPDYANTEVQKGNYKQLSLQEVDLIASLAPDLSAYSPQIAYGQQARYQNQAQDITIGGVNEQYLTIRSLEMESGRFISELDNQLARKVVVIGKGIADQLLKDVDPIGATIKIGDQQFVVIGVLAKETSTNFTTDNTTGDNYAYIPITTAIRLTGYTSVPIVFGQTADARRMSAARTQLEQALVTVRGTDHRMRVDSQDDMIELFSTITSVFTAILAGIGSISLLVGGIGVMNIMLVSVTERTREIGIRKALGAQKGDIIKQFLIESIVLCLLGGVFGIIFGSLGSALIASFAPWSSVLSWFSVFLAVSFSTLIGLIFGVYPAYKAAQLDPINALRYE